MERNTVDTLGAQGDMDLGPPFPGKADHVPLSANIEVGLKINGKEHGGHTAGTGRRGPRITIPWEGDKCVTASRHQVTHRRHGEHTAETIRHAPRVTLPCGGDECETVKQNQSKTELGAQWLRTQWLKMQWLECGGRTVGTK